jgi:hypothetical protein
MRNSRRDLFPQQNSKAIQRESGTRIASLPLKRAKAGCVLDDDGANSVILDAVENSAKPDRVS